MRLVGGPLDGDTVMRGRIAGSWGWLDPDALYFVEGDRLVFGGHGCRTCSCGATLRQDPDTGSALESCPLCGAREGAR